MAHSQCSDFSLVDENDNTSSPKRDYYNISTISTSSLKQTSCNTSLRTPIKQNRNEKSKTTPFKTPTKRLIGTPKHKTPNDDRFIPSRIGSNFELGHFKIHEKSEEKTVSKEIENNIAKAVCKLNLNEDRILAYRHKKPLNVLYTHIATPTRAKSTSRYIPRTPDRILDAPSIIDDYYLNLLDWNCTNVLAIALGPTVYLWDPLTGKTDQLCDLQEGDYVTSLSWIQGDCFLAVGTSSGLVLLWDCIRMKQMRSMDGHSARVGSLSWNSYIVSSGCRSGQIINHDVRQQEHIVRSFSGHSQEVCGLKWSADGRYLASGGNDNIINIWQQMSGMQQTLYRFTSHQAAVKALAWCPWQPHILASGGGAADGHIRFWNCTNGTCFKSIDAKSQVSSILWSDVYKELVSAHGLSKNQIVIWKYPGMSKVTELIGHTARILSMAISPDQSTLLSAGADETLRIWKCFIKKQDPGDTYVKKKVSLLKQSIR